MLRDADAHVPSFFSLFSPFFSPPIRPADLKAARDSGDPADGAQFYRGFLSFLL